MKNYKNVCSREDIIKDYVEDRKPVSVIAKERGVCQKTMKKAMLWYGIGILGRISANSFLRDKKWLKNEYIDKQKSIREIAIISGSTRGNVYSALKNASITTRTVKEGVSLKNRCGKNAGNWRGGKRLAGSHGRYIQILCHGNPHSNADGYVMEHILVMEKQLGRYLEKDEIVHHLDGDGHNNKIENLQLTSRKKHFKNHFDAVTEVKRLKEILDSNGIKY